MSERQKIRNPKENFTILPNMYDNADLTVYEFRLLIHYRRVGNCYESLRTTEKKCHMGKSTVVRARRSLAEKGWIKIQESDKGTIQVEVIDKWTAKTVYVGGTGDGVPQGDSIEQGVLQGDRLSQGGTECPRDNHEEVLINKNLLKSTKEIKDSSSLSQDEWVQVLIAIKQDYYRGRHTAFDKYWGGTGCAGRQDGVFRVSCTKEQQAWLIGNGQKIAENVLIGVLGKEVEVEFIVKKKSQPADIV